MLSYHQHSQGAPSVAESQVGSTSASIGGYAAPPSLRVDDIAHSRTCSDLCSCKRCSFVTTGEGCVPLRVGSRLGSQAAPQLACVDTALPVPAGLTPCCSALRSSTKSCHLRHTLSTTLSHRLSRTLSSASTARTCTLPLQMPPLRPPQCESSSQRSRLQGAIVQGTLAHEPWAVSGRGGRCRVLRQTGCRCSAWWLPGSGAWHARQVSPPPCVQPHRCGRGALLPDPLPVLFCCVAMQALNAASPVLRTSAVEQGCMPGHGQAVHSVAYTILHTPLQQAGVTVCNMCSSTDWSASPPSCTLEQHCSRIASITCVPALE